jgi:hypothetical protein
MFLRLCDSCPHGRKIIHYRGHPIIRNRRLQQLRLKIASHRCIPQHRALQQRHHRLLTTDLPRHPPIAKGLVIHLQQYPLIIPAHRNKPPTPLILGRRYLNPLPFLQTTAISLQYYHITDYP